MNLSIRTSLTLLTLSLLPFAAKPARAQQVSGHAEQPYVGFYDVYGGFTELRTPALGLNQKGFHTQLGINPRRWMSLGFDYSYSRGYETLTPGLLTPALQAQVAAGQAGYIKAGLLPPDYKLEVITDATTQTFALGPQLMFRHFQKVTFFVRPSLGALREIATPHPDPEDPFATAVTKQLAPTGQKLDWVGFYGAGGGADVTVFKNIGLRAQLDVVHDKPFSDILANGRWTYRFAVGPSIHFGHNVTR